MAVDTKVAKGIVSLLLVLGGAAVGGIGQTVLSGSIVPVAADGGVALVATPAIAFGRKIRHSPSAGPCIQVTKVGGHFDLVEGNCSSTLFR